MKIWTLRICRMLLGLVFVFSGFVKAIDPWGTALKISEYLGLYGLSGLSGMRIGLAILFSAVELTLGLMLVFGVKKRLTGLLALVFMAGFTLVTLLSATVLPVDDCGCFGDALHLSPWASLGKNVVLLALAIVVWWFGKGEKKAAFGGAFCATFEGRKGWIWAAAFACVSVILGVMSYRHLPMVDFLPFKKGVDLREAVYGEAALENRDGAAFGREIALREFVLFNSAGDATREILEFPGRVYMLFALSLDDINKRCAEQFHETIVRGGIKAEDKVILVTASPLTDEFSPVFQIPVYNMGSGTMLTMLRARTGIVVLQDGVIVSKKNCRDITWIFGYSYFGR